MGEALPPTPAVQPVEVVVATLALIDDQGEEAQRYPLRAGRHTIGASKACGVAFDDEFLGGHHCALVLEHGAAVLQPLEPVNGTFVRIAAPTPLQHGDVVRIGQEILRFERLDQLTAECGADGKPQAVGWPAPPNVWGRLCQLGMAHEVANAYLLGAPDVFLGRERGDILFPRDGFVSGAHAVLSSRDGQCYIKDLGSSNGTFLKAKRETPLRDGDLFLLGRNLLRLRMERAA